MAKAKKSVPSIYEGINPDNKLLHLFLMEDVDGNTSVFNNEAQLTSMKSYQELIAPTIRKTWKGLDAFLEENEQTVLTYHEQMFGANPPKDQDRVTTATYTWRKLVSQAKNQCQSKETVDPVTGRKSTIGNRLYFLGSGDTTQVIKTPQAQACYKIFTETLDKHGTEQPVNEKPTRVITEAVLKQAVIDRAGELKTRQDPWRIFQYYRPSLLKMGLIRHN
jgi:hypothetical protein